MSIAAMIILSIAMILLFFLMADDHGESWPVGVALASIVAGITLLGLFG